MDSSTKTIGAALDRKKLLLGVCLCLFALSLTYRLLNPFRQERVAKLTFEGGVTNRAASSPAKGMEPAPIPDRDVWLDLYQTPPHHSGKVLQNVFHRPRPSSNAAAVEETALAQSQPIASPEQDKRLQVQEELSRFKWFGQMTSKSERILFLERGKDILLVREKDRIDGKYLVKRITDKYLVLRAESIGEDVRIELDRF